MNLEAKNTESFEETKEQTYRVIIGVDVYL